MPQGMRVQVPPRALLFCSRKKSSPPPAAVFPTEESRCARFPAAPDTLFAQPRSRNSRRASPYGPRISTPRSSAMPPAWPSPPWASSPPFHLQPKSSEPGTKTRGCRQGEDRPFRGPASSPSKPRQNGPAPRCLNQASRPHVNTGAIRQLTNPFNSQPSIQTHPRLTAHKSS